MKISAACQRILGVLVAIILLDGCGGSSLQSPLGQSPDGGSARTQATANRDRSWMAPDAKRGDLLYISDSAPNGKNVVYVYSYPRRKLKGTLTGFNEPSGQCVDKAGDVFIANFGDSNILEYAHGGTTPIKTLSDTGYYPLGCSVDPTTGNLAVTNRLSTSFTTGDVAIYPKASGSPTSYTAQNFYYYEFCGYDNSGDLFIDGTTKGSALEYAELPSGGSAFSSLTLSQSIGFPGGVQWDSGHLAIGDQNAAVIYEFSISGSQGVEVGSTPLTGSKDVIQFWIQGKRVIGPDAGLAQVEFYKYPAGGSPTKVITGFGEPVGATISKAKSK